jgi:hypothetical protein
MIAFRSLVTHEDIPDIVYHPSNPSELFLWFEGEEEYVRLREVQESWKHRATHDRYPRVTKHGHRVAGIELHTIPFSRPETKSEETPSPRKKTKKNYIQRLSTCLQKK